MFPVVDGLVPSFPPLQDSSGLLAHPITSCPSSLYFIPICLLYARFCVFSRPPPVSGPPNHPPPIIRPSESYQPSGYRPTNVLLCFPNPASHMQVCTPTRPVRLVVLGLGVGGGAKETAPLAMVWSPLTRQQASPGLVCLCRRSIYLFHYCGARIYVCPPLPRMCQLNYFVKYHT